MLEIKVIHEIKFAKETGELMQLVAGAIAGALGANVSQVTTNDSVPTTVAGPAIEKQDKPEVENVAEKTRYFHHEPTGELIKVEKGKPLGTLEVDSDVVELKAYEYNRLKHEQEKAAEETTEQTPVEDTNDTTEETQDTDTDTDTDTSDVAIPTVEDLRVVAAKFQRNKKQKDLKAILDKFDAPKLSAIAEEDRTKALQLMKDTADELGLA